MTEKQVANEKQISAQFHYKSEKENINNNILHHDHSLSFLFKPENAKCQQKYRGNKILIPIGGSVDW